MAGIDNIIGQILQEAQEEAKGVIAAAEKEAASIREEAQRSAADLKKAADERSSEAVKTYAARSQSSADITKKKAILTAKQEMIEGIMSEALERLENQDDAAYFAMLKKILAKNVQMGDGTIAFSAKDTARLPKGFIEEAQAIAKKAGGRLKLAEPVKGITSGFVLAYGGIEENCSLEAIFEAGREKIQDKVYRFLFS